ncbi:MAG: DUF2029 domain-containing protein [Caldilinea sp. CFX5]|nr:DUF2029 domain-containing protein [Caldilinea sp. CFX5]
MSIYASLQQRFHRHTDFVLLFILFVSFRLSSVWFLRPGGYIRDYSDLIYYQSRASWQDFGLLPYRDYWSEYPPLFAWLSVWIDHWSRRIPLWEDERLWYVVPFGLLMALGESVTLLALYWVARRLYGAQDERRVLRVVWLYSGLFLPVYLLNGWFDALPVATIMAGLALLIAQPTVIGALGFGLLTGIGGLLKLVPLAMVALLPLATKRRTVWAMGAAGALLVPAAGYALAYTQGPVMTMAALRSLVERSGWSTLYAWSNGYTKLGAVVGDPFDPLAAVSLYTPWFSQRAIWLGWLVIGAIVFVFTWRQSRLAATPEQTARRLTLFAALTYTLLLLAYPAWNPQYALYLLPFLALLWPGVRGLLYALTLTALVLLEHPIYHNLLGPDYAPIYVNLVEADYQHLFLLIIVLRTTILATVAVDLGLQLWRPQIKAIWLPLGATIAVWAALFWSTPQWVQSYRAGREATSPLRPLVRFLNSDDTALPVVSQQLPLGRELRPLLKKPNRLNLMGGRPGRIEPLPTLAAQGPFLYIQTTDDDVTTAPTTDPQYGCATPFTIATWTLWHCNGATSPLLAQFAEGIDLLGATQPVVVRNRLHLTLLWRGRQPISRDYTVFLHLVDANGQMVGQWDQMPGAGAAPTATWQPNQVIVDDYQLPFQLTGAAPYQLLVGLYDPTTGQRLSLQAGVRPILPEARLQLYQLTLPAGDLVEAP